MNYAELLAWTAAGAFLVGSVWGWFKLGRVMARWDPLPDPLYGPVDVEQVVVGDLDPEVLRVVCDRVRERVGKA